MMDVGIDVMEVTQCKRLRWYEHLRRLNNTRMPNKVSEYNPASRRKLCCLKRQSMEKEQEVIATRSSKMTEVINNDRRCDIRQKVVPNSNRIYSVYREQEVILLII